MRRLEIILNTFRDGNFIKIDFDLQESNWDVTKVVSLVKDGRKSTKMFKHGLKMYEPIHLLLTGTVAQLVERRLCDGRLRVRFPAEILKILKNGFLLGTQH